MKKLLLTWLIFASTLVNAQFILNGKIYQLGFPLSHANVILQTTLLQTQSNERGEFEFKNLKADNYVLKITFLGSETKSVQLHLNNDTSINVILTTASLLNSEVVVYSTRSGNNDIAVSKISKQELEEKNFGQDVPYLLNQSTSVITTSDAGTGVGYSGLRIRGSDASRINITINGIPINDAESQNMYWVDLPDFASSVENIQLQRGVGSSTNGAGAFGGSINILSNSLSVEPYAQTSNGYGSFNTIKNNIVLGSGLLKDHWSVEGRLSRIKSDGFIDRGSADLKSYYVSAGYLSKKTLVRATIFSGHEITYQSWYGVPEVRLNNDIAGMVNFINNNYLDAEEATNLLNSGRSYNFYTYDKQVDDYQQDYYQLLFAQQISNSVTLNLATHLTIGKGFYEEYKKQQDLSSYNLPSLFFINGNSDTITTTDLIRRKWLDNDFYGFTYSLNYEANKKLKWNIGGAWNQYDGDHFNEITWSQYGTNIPVRYRYAKDNALKTDFNIYGKANYSISKELAMFCDLQFRTVTYHFNGLNQVLDVVPGKATLNFFNPKGGIIYHINYANTVYVSASVGNKEPSRDDYVDHTIKPKSENMIDYEGGYRFNYKKISAGINFYYMYYKNQLVVTGQLNDVGSPIRNNAGKSYREGAEIELNYNITSKLSLNANATLSKNKIKAFTEYIPDYDNGGQLQLAHSNTDIAYSPSLISAVAFIFKPVKNLQLQLIEKYVGKQFLDNTRDESRKLVPYQTLDARINYTLEKVLTHEINFGLMLNNILDAKYSSNGNSYPYYVGGKLITDNYLFPQAGFNVLGQIIVKF